MRQRPRASMAHSPEDCTACLVSFPVQCSGTQFQRSVIRKVLQFCSTPQDDGDLERRSFANRHGEESTKAGFFGDLGVEGNRFRLSSNPSGFCAYAVKHVGDAAFARCRDVPLLYRF